MDNHKLVVDRVYDFLITQIENATNTSRIDAMVQVRMIKERDLHFFLISTLAPEDVDFFMIKYVKYMKLHFEECTNEMIIDKFMVLRSNITETAMLLSNISVEFMTDDSCDNFLNGYLRR